MTDSELFEKACQIQKNEGCTEWYRVSKLANYTKDEKLKELIKDMAKRMYREEEYYAGLL